MNSRDNNNNTVAAPNANELWKLTDKKTKKYYFWQHEKQEQKIGHAAETALHNAQEAAFASLPLITAAGVKMMCDKSGGFMNLSALGLPVAIGGVVLDTVKAPFCLAIATEEAVRAGITKLVSLIFEKNPTQQAIDRIFNSFLMRMRETATILIVLGLEQPDVLDQKLKSGDIEDLVGLTLLHTAYTSRHFSSGLLLASNKRLDRADCPTEGLALFDEVMELKELIKAALELADIHRYRTEEMRDLDESRVVCQWIKSIKAGSPVTQADKPEATAAQLAIVNKIISQIDKLKQFGMSTLPQSSEVVVNRMRKA